MDCSVVVLDKYRTESVTVERTSHIRMDGSKAMMRVAMVSTDAKWRRKTIGSLTYDFRDATAEDGTVEAPQGSEVVLQLQPTVCTATTDSNKASSLQEKCERSPRKRPQTRRYNAKGVRHGTHHFAQSDKTVMLCCTIACHTAYGGVFAQRAHSVGTAPIITVIIQATTLKTTHLRNHAQSIQNSKIQTSDACRGSQGPKFCPL